MDEIGLNLFWPRDQENDPPHEEWRPSLVPGYEVSNHGHVRGRRGVLTLEHRKGYRRVKLRRRYYYVHVLAAAAFLKGWTKKLQVRHKDGHRDHNRSSNLILGTQVENEADKRLHGTHCVGLRNGNGRFGPESIRAVREAPVGTLREVAAAVGMSYHHAVAVRRGRYRREA